MLWLFRNQISDISPLSSLSNLNELWMEANQISDTSPLSSLVNLTVLRLYDNQISDITPLSSLTNLTELWLEVNQISDISALSSLTNLTWLYLNGNQINDISALVANPGLSAGDYIDLQNNPLSQVALDTHIPQLQARGVQVLYTSPAAVPGVAGTALAIMAGLFLLVSIRARRRRQAA